MMPNEPRTDGPIFYLLDYISLQIAAIGKEIKIKRVFKMYNKFILPSDYFSDISRS